MSLWGFLQMDQIFIGDVRDGLVRKNAVVRADFEVGTKGDSEMFCI